MLKNFVLKTFSWSTSIGIDISEWWNAWVERNCVGGKMSIQPLEVNWFIPSWDHTSLMISYRQYYKYEINRTCYRTFLNVWSTYRMICETRKWHKIGKAIPIKRHGRDWRINSIQQVTVRGNIVKHQKISITKNESYSFYSILWFTGSLRFGPYP